MKLKLGALLSTVAVATLPAVAQTESGSWEFSLAGNIGSYSSSSEYTSGGHTTKSESEARGFFSLDLRAGVYLVDGFSLEPEIYMLAQEKLPPAFNIGANASYTFTIPQSPVKPYVIAGYGIGNAVPVMQRMIERSSDEFDIPALRVGGGLKVFVSRQVALKLEYRYERYSQEESYSSYGYSMTSKSTLSFHNVLIGFSVFLPKGE